MARIKVEKEFLTVREVCKILGVSPYIVYKLLKQGELCAYRLPGKWLITRESVERFLERLNGEKNAEFTKSQ